MLNNQYWLKIGLNTKKAQKFLSELFCGLDGTRTRDPMRDRHVF